jgi:dihydrofolate synthase / folylpolyglutamate synthase
VTYPDSVAYLYQIGNELKHGRLGLERIAAINHALGRPDQQFKIVHVAGTNGKGSTCAMIEAGLRAAGLRVGLYTSPHLAEPTERIQIDRKPIAGSDFVAALGRVQAVNAQLLQNETIDLHSTYFETLTAMAFHLFAEQKVDWAVVEVGLGGRLDATNVVQPDLCVITPIDLDHTEYLGPTIADIAREKAGILKPGIPAVIAPQEAEAEEVIRARAAEIDCPVQFLRDSEITAVESHAWETRFRVADEDYRIPLAGRYQAQNGLVAVNALKRLGLAAEQISKGLSTATWPGRLEKVFDRPLVILDGAHNAAGARVLGKYLQEHVRPGRIHLIFGVMQDKPLDEMIEILFPLADDITITRPNSSRALEPKFVALAARGHHCRIVEDPEDALHVIDRVGPNDAVVVCGSLYLVGQVRPMLVHN